MYYNIQQLSRLHINPVFASMLIMISSLLFELSMILSKLYKFIMMLIVNHMCMAVCMTFVHFCITNSIFLDLLLWKCA